MPNGAVPCCNGASLRQGATSCVGKRHPRLQHGDIHGFGPTTAASLRLLRLLLGGGLLGRPCSANILSIPRDVLELLEEVAPGYADAPKSKVADRRIVVSELQTNVPHLHARQRLQVGPTQGHEEDVHPARAGLVGEVQLRVDQRVRGGVEAGGPPLHRLQAGRVEDPLAVAVWPGTRLEVSGGAETAHVGAVPEFRLRVAADHAQAVRDGDPPGLLLFAAV
mmetsp:Transcript_59574/g.184857  ORF Transcript_59574/g.184857 Transcript_59574/m.184857 type:complete len:222 (-) Transcript_59574:446-1111(-)